MTLFELEDRFKENGCDVYRVSDATQYHMSTRGEGLIDANGKPHLFTYEEAVATDWVVVKVATISFDLHRTITCCADAACVRKEDIGGYVWDGTWFHVLDCNGDLLFKFRTTLYPKGRMGNFPVNVLLYREQVNASWED